MPIIYYDGNCVYCYNYAIWLIQNGLSHKYEFATIKGQIGKQFLKIILMRKIRIVLFFKKEIIWNLNHRLLQH